MEGFELTYYKLLVGECTTSGQYGEDFLYDYAVKHFVKLQPLLREIIDTMGVDCPDYIKTDYLLTNQCLFEYWLRMGY